MQAAITAVLPKTSSSSTSSTKQSAEAEAAAVVAMAAVQPTLSTQISPSSPELLSDQALDYLWTFWKRMTAMFPGKWERENGAAPVKRDGELTIAGETWMQVLKGLRRSQIARGMSGCISEGREWPPNAPRFLTMCLDVPALASVEREMAPGRPQTGFTVLVRSLLDLHVYGSAEDGFQQRRMLQDAYERAVKHVVEGKPLPEPVLAIAQEKHGVAPVRDRESARAAMARAAADLGFDA